MKVNVIGAGLAGSEAAYYLAEKGYKVVLYDIKPEKFTPAHTDRRFCELVCSNSLKGADEFSNACGLLKAEMRVLGSLTMEAAEYARVPAGGALAVDRERFSGYVTEKLESHPNIEIVCKEIEKVPQSYSVIATGPLTTEALSNDISRICGGQLHFFDASAPIVSRDSLDFSKCFYGDRYGKGGDDYINCPMDREQYSAFVSELVGAERANLRNFEKGDIFEGCMPVEVMAERGAESLRFAMLKPVGLKDKEGNGYYAVLQLRKENAAGSAYNLVGFQTNLRFPEQKRVFSMIPALKNAEFLRYGVMHRNTFINSPTCLNADFSLKSNRDIFFAGQMTGVEGYVESAASGILAAIHMCARIRGEEPSVPPATTVCGALSAHISEKTSDFQPMNANFGLLPPLPEHIKDKKARYARLASRALEDIKNYAKSQYISGFKE